MLAASAAGSACVFLCHRSDRSLALCRARDHALAFADSDDRSFIDKGVEEAPCRFVLRVRVLLHRHGAHSRLLLRGEDETWRLNIVFSHADLRMDLVDLLAWGDIPLGVVVEVRSVLSVLGL